MQAPAADTALGAPLYVHAEVMAGEFPDGNDSDSEHVIGSVCSC